MIPLWYPLVNVYIAMENHYFIKINELNGMFNSHVKLPEGTTILNCRYMIYVPWSKDGFGMFW